MKKLTLLMTAFIVLLLHACSKKGDNVAAIKITAGTNSIKYNETLQLQLTNGNSGEFTWKSSNEFTGFVNSSGLFTASHIGKTTITAEKGNVKLSYDIIVSPTETFFTEPVAEFGATQASIKAKESRTLVDESATLLLYADPSPMLKGIIYQFEDDKLRNVLVGFNEAGSGMSRVLTYYKERYRSLGTSDGITMFETENGAIKMGITVNENLGLVSIYIPR